MGWSIPVSNETQEAAKNPIEIRYWRILIDIDDDDILEDVTSLMINNNVSGGGKKGGSSGESVSNSWSVALSNKTGIFPEGSLKLAKAAIEFKIGSSDYYRIFTGFVDKNGAQRSRRMLTDDVSTFTLVDATSLISTKKASSIYYTNHKICDPADVGNSLFHKLAAQIGFSASDCDVGTIDYVLPILYVDGTRTVWTELQEMVQQYLGTMTFRYDGKLRFWSPYMLDIWPTRVPEWAFSLTENNYFQLSGSSVVKNCTRCKTEFQQYEQLTQRVIYMNTDNWDNVLKKCAITVLAGAEWPGDISGSVAQLVFKDPSSNEEYPIGINIQTPTIGAVGSGADIECSGGLMTLVSFNGSTPATRPNANSAEIILKNNTAGAIIITKFELRGTPYRISKTISVKDEDATVLEEDHVEKTIPGKYAFDFAQAHQTTGWHVEYGKTDRSEYSFQTYWLPFIQEGAFVSLQTPEKTILCTVESYNHPSAGGVLTKQITQLTLKEYEDLTVSDPGSQKQSFPGGGAQETIDEISQELANKPTYDEIDESGWVGANTTNIPEVPVFAAQGVFKAITLLIAKQTSLTNFLRYEIQVSEDEIDWYATGLTDGWHGALDGVTESPLDYFVHAGILPSGTEEEPVGRSLYYRIRRVTKALVYSDWSTPVLATTSIIETADLAANSITANKLVTGLISALIAQISESLVVSSDYGWQAGNYISPVRGNKRSFVIKNEMALQEYDGTNWIYKVLLGWIGDRYGIKVENIEAIDDIIRIGKTLLIDQGANTVNILAGYHNSDWSAPETLSTIYGIPHSMENGQIVFVLYNSTSDSFSIRIKELDGTITDSELVPGSDVATGTGLYTACSDPDGNLFFSYQDSSSTYFRLLSRTIGGAWTDFGQLDSGSYGPSVTEIVSIKFDDENGEGKILYVINNAISGNNSILYLIYNIDTEGFTGSGSVSTVRTIPYHHINLIRTDDGTIRVLYQIDLATEYHTFDYGDEEFDAYTVITGNLTNPVMVPIGSKILICAYSGATSTYRTVIVSFTPTSFSLAYTALPERFYALFRNQDGIIYGWDSLTAPVEQRILSPYEKVVIREEIGDMVTSARTTKRHCLFCDGSAISRTVYSDLFLAIGTTWGAGDGSTTFNIPDMRGASPGCAGTSAGFTQNETITLATKYDDRIQGHRHLFGDGGNYGGSFIGYSRQAGGNAFYRVATTDGPSTDGTNGTPRVGPTTHGKLVGVNLFIIYE